MLHLACRKVGVRERSPKQFPYNRSTRTRPEPQHSAREDYDATQRDEETRPFNLATQNPEDDPIDAFTELNVAQPRQEALRASVVDLGTPEAPPPSSPRRWMGLTGAHLLQTVPSLPQNFHRQGSPAARVSQPEGLYHGDNRTSAAQRSETDAGTHHTRPTIIVKLKVKSLQASRIQVHRKRLALQMLRVSQPDIKELTLLHELVALVRILRRIDDQRLRQCFGNSYGPLDQALDQ
jgi:hypothetical protein